MPPEQFQQKLLSWFDKHGRKELPWQQTINPYRVWVSEIMLQQTQAANVIPYFNRFIERFPDLQSLAAAELDEVLPYWSGLGYYARARNLHKTARLVDANNGEFPTTVADLSSLPGIGRSTAGAILSIAYAKSEAILDGNVKRVLARFHAISGWTGGPKVSARLWEISKTYTPAESTAAYTQAIMDLGATLCTRNKPKCGVCPLAAGCKALELNLVKRLPEPKPRKPIPVKKLFFLILQNAENRVFLEKRPPMGIWGGLWSLPEFSELKEIQDWAQQKKIEISNLRCMSRQRHGFSHYQLEYTPVLANLINLTNNVMETDAGLWYKFMEIDAIGLPSPVKRLLQYFRAEENYEQNG
ncbi:MAG: A/G-specific adenine glycosylase [Methylomonas sp.]